MKLGEAVYKSQQKPGNNDKGTGAGGGKDAKPNDKENVVDADFEDKEDKEKAPKIIK